jgi:hypothetical protein
MDELKDLISMMEDHINDFLSNAKKEVAPKSAWARARKLSLVLQKEFKQFRSLSVAAAKTMKEKK